MKQGAILSPLLFIICIDKCFREICIRQDVETTFAYADDVAIITENKEQLQEAMFRWNEGLTSN